MPEQIRPYSFLFADYCVELSKHWSTKSGYTIDDGTGEPEVLKVIYGQPDSAFRRLFTPDNINRQVNMPILNFYISGARRLRERQNPYASWTEYDGKDGAYRHRAGQVYEVSYSVSLWTADNKRRDDILSQILRDFNTSLSLKHYFDPNDSSKFMWMQWSAPEDFQDTTELESLTEKSTRKFVRTDFTFLGEAVVPLESNWYNAIKNIQVDQKLLNMYGEDSETKFKMEILESSEGDISFQISTDYF